MEKEKFFIEGEPLDPEESDDEAEISSSIDNPTNHRFQQKNRVKAEIEKQKIEKQLKNILEAQAWEPEGKVERYQFVYREKEVIYKIPITKIKGLVSDSESVEGLAEDILEFYGYGSEKSADSREADIAKSMIADKLNKMMDHWEKTQAKETSETQPEKPSEPIQPPKESPEEKQIRFHVGDKVYIRSSEGVWASDVTDPEQALEITNIQFDDKGDPYYVIGDRYYPEAELGTQKDYEDEIETYRSRYGEQTQKKEIETIEQASESETETEEEVETIDLTHELLWDEKAETGQLIINYGEKKYTLGFPAGVLDYILNSSEDARKEYLDNYLNDWGEYITEELGSDLADNEKKKLNFSIKKLIGEQISITVEKKKRK